MTYANERAAINSHFSGARARGRRQSEGQQTTAAAAAVTTTAGRDGRKSSPSFSFARVALRDHRMKFKSALRWCENTAAAAIYYTFLFFPPFFLVYLVFYACV